MSDEMNDDPAFDAAVACVLEHEGGYVDDPADPGGATNWGISLRYARKLGASIALDIDHDGDVDADDIRQMPRPVAKEVYRTDWWDRYGYGRLPAAVGVKVMDTAVNMGPKVACRILQESCTDLGQPCAEDGILGPATVAAVRCCDPDALLADFRRRQAGHYQFLIQQNRDLERFRKGWLARAAS